MRGLAAPTLHTPEATALDPLWLATTDAAGVTELLDRRTFAADTEDFKTKFPSLRALYGDLSTDIHQAIGSEELFKRVSDRNRRALQRAKAV